MRLLPAAPSAPRPAPRPVPERPRLAPGHAVLRRAEGTVQVGLDPAAAVVLDGLDPPLAALLRGLDGSRRRDELLADAVGRGSDPVVVGELLAGLTAAGLLHDAATGPAPPGADAAGADAAGAGAAGAGAAGAGAPGPARPGRAGAVVVVTGAGRVGVAVACLLATAGVGRIHVRGGGVVAGVDLGTGFTAADVGRTRADAAADAVARAAAAARTVGRATDRSSLRAGEPDGSPAARYAPRVVDLEVLADAEVADPARVRGLVARGRPHLAARVREGVGLVGPLVRPGAGACLRCVELARADDDPDWPWLAAQLALRTAPAPVAVALATAALAADQVLAVLDHRGTGIGAGGGTGGAAGAGEPLLLDTVAEVDLRRASIRHHRIEMHPLCPCVPAARRDTDRAA